MTLPDGIILDLNLETGEVSSGDSVESDFTAYSNDDPRLCAISINTVSEYHLGQWRCDISVEEQIPEVGYIALLNNTMGFVRDVRLPRHALPESYNLTLIPFIEENNYTIKGMIDISGNIVDVEEINCDYKRIVMHTRDTYINEDSIAVSQDLVDFNIASVGFDVDRDFVIIYLEESLLPNQPFSLHMDFVSQLQANLAGFYRSSYFD